MRHLPCAAATAAIVLALTMSAAAQTGAAGVEGPPLGSLVDENVLRGLPLGGNVYALLETTQPEVIADRFNSGGLNVGEPSRAGGFLGSWSQTLFRVGDLDVSDPAGSGASLLFPETLFWQRVRIDTGLMPADLNTPGLAVTLEPRRAGNGWTRIVGASGSGGGLAGSAPGNQPPPVVRLRDFGQGSALVSGPVTDRVGLVAAGSWAQARRLDRQRAPLNRSMLLSGFTHVVFARSAAQEWRALAWVQRGEAPFHDWQPFQDPSATTRDTSVHLQSTWEQHPSAGAQWRVFGGFTARSRKNAVAATPVMIERISDGPVSALVDEAADTTAQRLAAGLRFAPRADAGTPRHRLRFGADVARAAVSTTDPFNGTVRELVNGLPARLWTYSGGSSPSDRRSISVSGYANDAIAVSSTLSLDLNLRAEIIHGRAEGAATAVDWRSVLPAAKMRWLFAERRRIALVSGYARSANALNLNWLAYGDPAAPVAAVAAAALPGVLVGRVGPGTGGDATFSRIDADVGRPFTDEFVVGLEWRQRPSTRYTLTGIARRESNLLGVVNTGAPTSSYTAIALPDAGQDRDNPADDRTLTVYSRLPSSFGHDAYLLTNPGQQAATAFALKLTAEHDAGRLFVLFGATASAATGSGGNRGYGPLENDQDVPGELFTNPNAATYARGRLFSDRAFTIKWTTLYRMPRDFTVGAIARYQDGQPFSRLVVVPGLAQGAEAVQAYPNAGSRFTFTGTLDLRVQKGFAVGRARVDAILEAYNLFTRSNEVEEYVVGGPLFRTPTAIEPPHTVHVGLRLTF